MNTENLDAAVLAWVRTCPALRGAIRLGYLGPRSGDVSVTAADRAGSGETAFIDGTRLRRYDFAVALTLPVSPDDDGVNQTSWRLTRRWMDWIDGRERAGDYPDLGPGRSAFELENRNAAPAVVRWSDNGLAKFQFFATLYYQEV